MFEISSSLLELESVAEIDAELSWEALLPVTDPEYRPPSSEDVRLLLDDAGLTQGAAAALLGVTDRAVRGWLAQSSIPYTAWRALLWELGVLDRELIEPACANWWLVNQSPEAESMACGPYPIQIKRGPYPSYRMANNFAAQKNAASFAKYLVDYLEANEVTEANPDYYEHWESVREEWLESHAVIYKVVHRRDLD